MLGENFYEQLVEHMNAGVLICLSLYYCIYYFIFKMKKLVIIDK